MTMLTLFHMPGACSRISLNALEEIGKPYQDHGVALMRGEQYGHAYVAMNPKSKVPMLKVGDVFLTETPAILHYLANTSPEARLLPCSDSIAQALSLADLSWCASSLHPMVHRIFRPSAYAANDTAQIKADALTQFSAAACLIEQRVCENRWWYGDAWSIVDVNLCWLYSTAAQFGFELNNYAGLTRHRERVEQRPSFLRALERERDAVHRFELPLPAGVML
ncbi:glutathione S-transferase family protein [Pseudomonas sp. Z18(2022)]|uniref:glutathione S-transferase family protein n=1 Tax=Pseudomonas sp. Z18(2022) TaxID=2983410 RepID=UPI002E806406|nr:glutathione S-transferase family protein [Pseudomonas sp. Z18(2022)]